MSKTDFQSETKESCISNTTDSFLFSPSGSRTLSSPRTISSGYLSDFRSRQSSETTPDSDGYNSDSTDLSSLLPPLSPLVFDFVDTNPTIDFDDTVFPKNNTPNGYTPGNVTPKKSASNFDSLENIREYESDTESTVSLTPSILDLHTSVLPMKELYKEVKTTMAPLSSPRSCPEPTKTMFDHYLDVSLEKEQRHRVPHVILEGKRSFTFSGKKTTNIKKIKTTPEIPFFSYHEKSFEDSKDPLSPTGNITNDLSNVSIDETDGQIPRLRYYPQPLSMERETFPVRKSSILHLNDGKKKSLPEHKKGTGTHFSLFSKNKIVSGETSSSSIDSKKEQIQNDEELLLPVISDCIKEELRCKIQLGRLRDGKEELKVDFQEPHDISEMSLEEIRQRNLTKEKNRWHARLSRQRSREEREKDKMKHEVLMANRLKLRKEVFKLRRQKSILQNTLQEHENSGQCKSEATKYTSKILQEHKDSGQCKFLSAGDLKS